MQVIEITRHQASLEKRANHRLFRLQMAYLQLWWTIERYITFRYRAGDWIKKLSREKGFGKPIQQHVPKPIGLAPTVVNVRYPGEGEVFQLDPSQPSECLRFYQLRHNETHRASRGQVATRTCSMIRSPSLCRSLNAFCKRPRRRLIRTAAVSSTLNGVSNG